MRLFVLALALLATASVFSQKEVGVRTSDLTLNGTRWKTSIHCFTSDEIMRYDLYPPDTAGWEWGNFISFGENTFTTSYAAPCGMDCFTTVTGTYKSMGGNKFEFFVESIDRRRMCDKESEEPQRVFGIYRLEKTESGMVLIKI